MVKVFEEFSMKLPVLYEELSSSMRRRVREEYIRRQENKCSYCHLSLDGSPPPRIMNAQINAKLFPPGMFAHPIHLHHSRETGLTLGAVHARCNAYLWQYEGQ